MVSLEWVWPFPVLQVGVALVEEAAGGVALGFVRVGVAVSCSAGGFLSGSLQGVWHLLRKTGVR